MNKNYNAGDIVESLAGHDAGKYFVIISMNGIYAQIANGKLHKLENPKTKKIKHLKNTDCTYEQLTGVQFGIENITNPKLRKVITSFKNYMSGASGTIPQSASLTAPFTQGSL